MSNVFQTYLKDFKLKMMVVEPKMIKPIESDEQSVNQFSSTGRIVHKPFIYSKMLVQIGKG